MGYTTKFNGQITIDPPLNKAEITFLQKFNDTRRMDCVEGPYYVDNPGFRGQDERPGIIDYNRPPAGQPGLWCKWTVSDDGKHIEWDGNEKFYCAGEWMSYLIEHFIKPGAVAVRSGDPQFAEFQQHMCNGIIYAQGEDPDDRWKLVVRDNAVRVVSGTFRFDDEED